jgi:hypothetical protein
MMRLQFPREVGKTGIRSGSFVSLARIFQGTESEPEPHANPRINNNLASIHFFGLIKVS